MISVIRHHNISKEIFARAGCGVAYLWLVVSRLRRMERGIMYLRLSWDPYWDSVRFIFSFNNFVWLIWYCLLSAFGFHGAVDRIHSLEHYSQAYKHWAAPQPQYKFWWQQILGNSELCVYRTWLWVSWSLKAVCPCVLVYECLNMSNSNSLHSSFIWSKKRILSIIKCVN